MRRARLRRAQERILAARPYAVRVRSLLDRVSQRTQADTQTAPVLVNVARGKLVDREALLEARAAADRRDVAADGAGQEQVVVGDACAHAATQGRVPPMLHVAFEELTSGGAQDENQFTRACCSRQHRK